MKSKPIPRRIAVLRSAVRAQLESGPRSLPKLRGEVRRFVDRWLDVLLLGMNSPARVSANDYLGASVMSALEDKLDLDTLIEDAAGYHWAVADLDDKAFKRFLVDWHTLMRADVLVAGHESAVRLTDALNKRRREIEGSGTKKLHRIASGANWDEGHTQLFFVIRNRKCSIATASMIYWRSQPGIKAGTPWDKERAALATEIERYVKAKRFVATGNYDPIADRGWTKRELASRLTATKPLMHFACKSGAQRPLA